MPSSSKATLLSQKRPKTLLSLFDGTGSICKPFKKAGWTVRRLDIDGKHGADIVTDIRQWDPSREWSGPPPDVIFAGPPCEHYSSARTRAKTPRNLKLADSLVAKTVEIIEYFHAKNPRLQYFVENPDSSMLWKRWVSHRLYEDVSKHYVSAFVRLLNEIRGRKSNDDVTKAKCASYKISYGDAHVVRLDYCMYGTKYRKRTRLMSNSPFKGAFCNGKCSGFKNGRHSEAAQRGPYKKGADRKLNHTLDELHAYPNRLVKKIFRHVNSAELRERTGVSVQSQEPQFDPIERAAPEM